ncbi:ECF-type sigma factor [Roseateles asaccharophilus]|uniref:RNA polymerase sigma factor (TIGR02999 family) n=1 Tax=Roseateles asaccharophilus TaxID=582607 RepID=A0ABU2AEC6_9BURK|nr:ECF-type sigma factor [Roseateles asaccharophilus]MDR7335546.1 RNA polymerase sigma factor (TIGR02999 family) [Roseateles asaccharophilus]
MTTEPSEITGLLTALAGGDALARDRLYTALYPELKRLARSHLAGHAPMTLEPAALIHEVWLKSAGREGALHRAQFFAHASKVMRSVIVDHLRERRADKRGGGAQVTLSTTALEQLAPPDVLKLDDVLQTLERADGRAHQVVEMRFFGGLDLEEIADALGVSVPTVKRDWRKARAFLFDALQT